MKLLEVQIDFFVPLWRRVVLVAFCFLWSLVEFNNGMVFWGGVFVAIGAYSLWQFFFDGWPATHAVGDQVENEQLSSDQVISGSSAEDSSTEESSANSINGANTSSVHGTELTGITERTEISEGSNTASRSSNKVASDVEKNHV